MNILKCAFVFFTISSYVHSLLPGDVLKANIVYLSRGQLVVDRGSEDGIKRGEYLQLIQNSRYKSRAIAIKVDQTRSLWALYYRYEPLILKNQVTLKPAKSHKLSQRTKQKINITLPSKNDWFLMAYPAKKVKKSISKDSEQFHKKYGLIKKYNKKTYIDKLLEEENPIFDKHEIAINASPFSFTNISGNKQMNYAVKYHSRGQKDLKVTFSYNRSSYVESFSGNVHSTSRYNLFADYMTYKINEKTELFALLTMDRLREESNYPILAHVNVAPIGIRRVIIKSKGRLNYIRVGFAPMLDFLNREEIAGDGSIVETSKSNLRHAFMVDTMANFLKKKLILTNRIFYRPLQKISENSLDFSDIYLQSITRFKYNIDEKFSASYINKITDDVRQVKSDTIPNQEIVHTFALGYQFTF